jgi:hypothetical protein
MHRKYQWCHGHKSDPPKIGVIDGLCSWRVLFPAEMDNDKTVDRREPAIQFRIAPRTGHFLHNWRSSCGISASNFLVLQQGIQGLSRL